MALLLSFIALTAAEPVVEWSVDKASISVGDPVTATLVYRWPADWLTSAEPEPSAELAGVFVSDLPPVAAQDTGSERRRTFRITLVATRSGAWELPRPALRIRSPAGEAKEFRAPQVVVQVGAEALPVRLPATRPVWTRPMDGARTVWWPWLVAGVVAAGLLTTALLWRRAHREPPVPLIERTRRALEHALAVVDPRESATAVSLALRRFSGETWDFDGAGATTRETADILRRLGDRVPADERSELLRLLNGLDDLRWAPGELTADRIQPLAEAGRRWAEGVSDRLAQPAPERR